MGDRLDQSFPSRQVSQRNPTRQVFEHLSLTLLLYKMMDIQEHLWCICRLLLGVQYVSILLSQEMQRLKFNPIPFGKEPIVSYVYSGFFLN